MAIKQGANAPGSTKSDKAAKEEQETVRIQSKHAWWIAGVFAAKDVFLALIDKIK